MSEIYLVYEKDFNGLPLRCYADLEVARAWVVELAAREYQAMRESPWYTLSSDMVSKWVEKENEWTYSFTERNKVFVTGEWAGTWGTYMIVRMAIREGRDE